MNDLGVMDIVVVLGSIVLVGSRWLPSGARRRVALAAAAVVAVGAALSLPGMRWYLLPVLAADLLVGVGAGVAWLLRRRAGRGEWRARWWLALPGSVLCLALIAVGVGAAWALPVPEFPQPSGPSAVGTTVQQWTDAGRDGRVVVAQLWYPAQPIPSGTQRAQYLGRTRQEADIVAAAEAGYLGAPAFLLDGAVRSRSHAAFDAAPAAGRFPVVLFSPGLGGVRTQNTAWAEDLASRGYVVAGVDHPYDSAAVVLADGSTVRTRVAASGNAAEDDRRRAGWVDVRAADLSFVLTRLGELTGPLAGRLDTGRVAATGHSVGGAAAMRAAGRDPRFTAVINLDGGPDPDQGPLRQPVLALTHPIESKADTEYLALLSGILERGAATSYRLTVRDSAHLSFTDAPLYLPPVPALVGSLGRTESVRMSAATCAAFLDATLRGLSVDVPAALARYGDLRVNPPATGLK
ncbi:putative dienelactone hydrolase [Actinoplanes octamycinicus]|uniref:Putative dienelactone hydrolase n=1 Tax=Actinoplanes octamycinicus TaxID=135948 RepID=A0A7W7MAP3_9ACTN|nr:dienelactone hydrolase family protein [Actinoplanes octamycinicus]MBB4743131.1 putative dienelactone hydrolase [Actinoplanes octamycinicus]GIE61307.1 carboxylic ester hydrolase [Actinoplanes octamycinicus]